MFLKISQYYIKAPVLESPFNKNAGPQESLFNKVTGPQACNFMKKRLQHRCFPVKFTKFLRAPILKSICERLTASIYWFQILIVDSTHFSSSYISILPEKLRKDLVFSRFQGVWKWNTGIKTVDISRSSCPEVFYKKGVLTNSTKFTGNTCASLFFNKVTLAQVFSCEFCEISKNTFWHRTPLVADSENLKHHLTAILDKIFGKK